MRRRSWGIRLLAVGGLTVWLLVAVAGPGSANQVPEACTRPFQVIQSDPELRALCLSGNGATSGVPDTEATSGSGASSAAWLVGAALVGSVVLAGVAGAAYRNIRRLHHVA